MEKYKMSQTKEEKNDIINTYYDAIDLIES